MTYLPSRRGLALILSLAFILSLMAQVYYIIKTPLQPQPAWYTLSASCRQPDAILEHLTTLAVNIHNVLKTLKVPHALCYGTLWGALRQGHILPWDTNVDFCAMDAHFVNVSGWQLKKAFSEKGIVFHYDWTSGVYHARSHQEAEGRVYVFTASLSRDWGDVVVPGGWVKSMWRWLGQKQLSFPAWLLQAPFQEVSFHGQRFPVPHDGVELLKYLYPQDWWMEVKPPGC